MDDRQMRPRGVEGVDVSPKRKSGDAKYEKLAEITIEKEQAVNQEAALRAQIRDEEGKRDTRRKALGAGAAYAHARIDLVWRDSLVAVLQKAGSAMKTERSRNEMAALVDWVKNGC
ncbi:MAG: hypothetical protein ACRD19_13785, partial [Terriglobia bacterium]